jgi:hypothetical protein
MGFFKDLKKKVRGMQNQMQPPMSPRPTSMGNKFDRMFGMSRRQTPSPMMRGGAEFGPPSLEDMLRNQAPGFLKKRIKRRMPSRRPSSRFFGGGLGSILERLPQNMERMFIDERRNFDELGMEDELPLLPRAPLPMPQDMPRERFPMMRPGFAEGEEVNMNMRIADLGANQGISPPEQRMMLLQKTAADMGRNISDRDAQLFGMGEISFEEAMSRAMPASERLERMMMGGQGRTISDMDRDRVRIDIPRAFDEIRDMDIQERNLMQQEQLGFAEGGAVESEIDKGLQELQEVAPEAQVIQQVMTMVMEMIQSGASEEQIMQALMQMGLDEEDIQQVMMMIAEQMQGQDPIQSQLSQMM